MLKKLKSSQVARGFSLIEIMIVMAIVAGILVGIAVFISSSQKSIRADKATSGIRVLQTQVEGYRTRHGRLPEDLESTMPPGSTTQEKQALLNDPWAHPYKYQTPSTHDDPNDFDIWSMGPNNDDSTIIGSWQ